MKYFQCIKEISRHSVYLAIATALLTSGCASINNPKATRSNAENHTLDEIDTLLQQAEAQRQDAAFAQPNKRVNDALMPSLDVPSPTGKAETFDRRFNINISNADIRQVLMGLVEGTRYNMVLDPQVSGEISLSLKEVTIEQVMGILRDIYGYEYRLNGNSFHVTPAVLQTRVYPLNYLNVLRDGFSQTKISSGQITETDSGGSSGSETSGESSGGGDRNTSGSMIKTTSQADLWKEVKATLNSIIGQGEGRSIIVSPQSGIVVVRALPKELRDVENFLEAAQGNLNRQVILEAKVIEVELSDGYQSGINWAAIGEHDGDPIRIGQTGGGSLFDTGKSEISGSTGNLDPSTGQYTPVANTATSAFGGMFSTALKVGNFTAFIELLKTQGNVQVLSSPRISTVNNQKAVIKVGTDEYFVTKVKSGSVSGTGNDNNTVAPEIELTPFFSGIALDVTPQVNRSGDVTLHIHPTVSEVKDQTKVITVSSKEQRLPLALSSVRESDSIVRAQNGQLIVIGGLMQTRKEMRDASVPGLSKLPLLGNLFRHEKEQLVKSELVILLRPTVVNSQDTWSDMIKQSGQRIQQLNSGGL